MDDTLRTTFAVIGPLRSVLIMRRPNTKTTGRDSDKPTLSMGFGFVEFSTAEHAKQVRDCNIFGF